MGRLFFLCFTLFFSINAQLLPRQALEIIIGGGGSNPSPPPEYQNCPPPPPPPCPPPPPPPSPPPPPRRSPPPPPPRRSPPPPPSPPFGGFESALLQKAFPVIQKFRLRLDDPNGFAKTWQGKKICQTYKGFHCDIVPDKKQKTVSGLTFNNFNFGSSDHDLNDFLFGLNDIAFFHANSNRFNGTIPKDVGKLKYLYELDLSNNKLSGTFPTQVLSAKQLVFLDFRFNAFFGVVPPQLFLLDPDLIFINNNNFVQNLPDNLFNTRALFLTLANNKFIGKIPSAVGKASNYLQEILFLNNQLSGCLPYQIGLLNKATVFDVGTNLLSGPIPHSFQCLQKMELLNLAHNKFYGVVPEAVCSLPGLSNFTISYNYFTQVGPECRKLINKRVLHLKMNCILGLPDQRSAADCDTFFSYAHTCPDEKSLTYVPCSKGYSHNELESSDLQWTAPSPAYAPSSAYAPSPASKGRSYGSLSPH